jgi:hypothetical protein
LRNQPPFAADGCPWHRLYLSPLPHGQGAFRAVPGNPYESGCLVSTIKLFNAITGCSPALASTSVDVWHTCKIIDPTKGVIWQQPLNVRRATPPAGSQPPPPRFANAIACVGDEDFLHVVVTRYDGKLFHTMRSPDGSWQPFDDVKATASQMQDTGPLTSVACCMMDSSGGRGLLVYAIDNGPHRVWFTLRRAYRDWIPWVDGKLNDPSVDSLIQVATGVANNLDAAPGHPSGYYDGAQIVLTFHGPQSVWYSAQAGNVVHLKESMGLGPGWRSAAVAGAEGDQLMLANGDGRLKYMRSPSGGPTNWPTQYEAAQGYFTGPDQGDGDIQWVTGSEASGDFVVCGVTSEGYLLFTRRLSNSEVNGQDTANSWTHTFTPVREAERPHQVHEGEEGRDSQRTTGKTAVKKATRR